MQRARTLIIGGGIAGLATAWALARRGERGIVVVEREAALAQHSTAKNAAILRTPMPDPVGEVLAREGAELMRNPPPGFSAAPLVDECGVILVSPRSKSESTEWEARLDRRDDARKLSRADFAKLAPHWKGEFERAWLLPREGRIELARLVDGFANGARERGVAFELGACVRSLLVNDGRVQGVLLSDGRRLEAQTTVLAAGAWAAELGRTAGAELALHAVRRHILVSVADARIDARLPIVWTDGDPFYARPEAGGWMVCACDESVVAPDALALDPAVEIEIQRKVARILPDYAPLERARFWAGFRPTSADERFVIGPDAQVQGLFWVACLGGHGMSSSFVIGAIAAELLATGASAHPLASALAPARFAALGLDAEA